MYNFYVFRYINILYLKTPRRPETTIKRLLLANIFYIFTTIHRPERSYRGIDVRLVESMIFRDQYQYLFLFLNGTDCGSAD